MTGICMYLDIFLHNHLDIFGRQLNVSLSEHSNYFSTFLSNIASTWHPDFQLFVVSLS